MDDSQEGGEADVELNAASAADLFGVRHERGGKAIARDRPATRSSLRPSAGLDRAEILVHVAAEIGGIVGIQGHEQARCRACAAADAGADRRRRRGAGWRAGTPSAPCGRGPGAPPGHRPPARGCRDRCGRRRARRAPPTHTAAGPLRRHGRPAEAFLPGAAEDVLELAGGMAGLRRVQTDADDAILQGERLIQRAFGVGLVEMAQEAHDQPRPADRACSRHRQSRRAGRPSPSRNRRRARCGPAGSKNIST